MKKNDDIELKLIEAKIDQSLDSQDQELFDRKMSDSESFRAEYEFQNSVIQTLIQSERVDLKKEFQEYLIDSRELEVSHKRKRTWLMAACVSLLAMVAIGYAVFFNAQSLSSQELYLTYYEPYPSPPVTRGAQNPTESESLAYYKSSQYKEAIISLLADEKTARNMLYLAICYLETDQAPLAIETLKANLDTDDAIMAQTSAWYLGLSYLNANDLASCKVVMQKIVDERQLYYRKAEEVLKNLE